MGAAAAEVSQFEAGGFGRLSVYSDGLFLVEQVGKAGRVRCVVAVE